MSWFLSIVFCAGFRWERLAAHPQLLRPIEQACARLHSNIPVFTWDAGVIEGHPLTYGEVETLLNGNAIAGRKQSDQEQVLNFAAGIRRLRGAGGKRQVQH
jgi:hypothetical protein